jgi:hypothetical protein
MEIIINELSLDGKNESIEEFMISLRSIIKIQVLLESASFTMFKHPELYNTKVTNQHRLYDILIDNSTRTTNEIRVFKKLLNKLMYEEPYWTNNPKHKHTDRYICDYTTDTHGYSIAEACERDKFILSFENDYFKDDIVPVLKNGKLINIHNIYRSDVFSELLLELKLIEYILFCNIKFQGTKLSFEFLEDRFGFDILNNDQSRAYISTFNFFIDMEWDDILIHDGLEYKRYNPSSKSRDWFRYSIHQDKDIYKFRVSEKYRCFGFRENDVFCVLRFETDHSISDHG